MNDLGNKEIFAKNLQYYMNINNKDRNDIARDLDLPYTTITSWCKGLFYPRIDKIQLLANYFGVQKADLVEDKEKNINNQDISFDSTLKSKYGLHSIELLTNFNKLNNLGKAKALENIKDLTEIQKYSL